MWCHGNRGNIWMAQRGQDRYLKRLIFTLESRPNWFFITLALRGFVLFSLLLSFFLNGLFFFLLLFFPAWQPWLWQLQIWSLTYSFSSLASNGWISGTVNWMPPLSSTHRLCLGGEDYLPDLKCSQLAATDSMIIAQVTLPSLLKCKRSGAWPPCGMRTLFIHFLLLALDIIAGNVTYWGSCFFPTLMGYLAAWCEQYVKWASVNDPLFALQRGDLYFQ